MALKSPSKEENQAFRFKRWMATFAEGWLRDQDEPAANSRFLNCFLLKIDGGYGFQMS